MQRDDWMLGEGFPFEDQPDQRKESKQSKPTEEPKVYTRELNPVIKAKSEGSPVPATSTTKSTQSLDWTAVLVKRAVAIIESGEKSLEEVAVERFGSIGEFQKALQSVESYKRIKYNLKFPNETCERNVQKREIPEVISPAKQAPTDEAFIPVDVNKLTAQKMKAELKGDFETARKLEVQIEAAKKAASAPQKVTLLPTETYSRRRAEEEMTIAEMVRHEKLASNKEFDREFGARITGNKRFRDDLDSLDEQVADKIGSSKQFNLDANANALKDYQKAEKIASECWFCTESQRFKHEGGEAWIIARGSFCYLAIPKHRSIHPLHCLIVPYSHCCSFMDCNEFEDEIWEEARNFKKCLLQMAAAQDRSFVFMECVTRANDPRRHAFIDCIPTPRNVSVEEIRSHFYKALQDADEEWSQNKRIIDTATKGGLRSSLPRRQFPYFYVDFRLDQGFAHVIEDSDRFGGPDFGRDMMASLLKVPRAEWRSHKSTSEDKKYFVDKFKDYDWTRK